MTCSKSMLLGLLVLVFGLTLLLYNPTPLPKPLPKPPIVLPTPIVKSTDGDILFWQDGLLVKPILKHTGSHLTHAAILIDGYIYEAVPPRVHKVLLADYIKEMKAKKRSDFRWFVMEPNEPYSKAEVNKMRKYLESQLGRPYMLRGWWKGREVRGIFCSQLVGNAIEKTGRIESSNFHESPGSLYKKIVPIYTRQP